LISNQAQHLLVAKLLNKSLLLYGFLEAPYRKVVKEEAKDGSVKMRVTDEIVYIAADEEEDMVDPEMERPKTKKSKKAPQEPLEED
jgi:hypothetical protein